MKVYISYFYKLRFFPQNLIPVSTAAFDPAWYSAKKNGVKLDKRGVVTGINYKVLSPSYLNDEDQQCKTCDKSHSDSCKFLKAYRKYLDSLYFDDVMRVLEATRDAVDNTFRREGSDICLMVYEAPDNPCSERAALIDYFAANGVELIEFQG